MSFLQVEISFWERVKRAKEGLELAGFWQWGTSPGKGRVASRSLSSKKGDEREERTRINLRNLQTYTWKGKIGTPSRHHQRCQEKSHSNHQCVLLTCPDRRSQLCCSGRASDPTQQRDSAGVEVWTGALDSGPSFVAINKSLGLLEPLSGLSFSSDSFLTRIIWRLKYGVVLNLKTQWLQGWEDESSDVSVWLVFHYCLLPSQESLDTCCCHNDNHK